MQREIQFKPGRYLWTDAEILWAIVSSRAKEGINKEGIIRCVDSIQYLILTDEEITGGLNRLKSGGFISENNNQYKPVSFFINNIPKLIKGKLSTEYKYCYKTLGLKVNVGWVE